MFKFTPAMVAVIDSFSEKKPCIIDHSVFHKKSTADLSRLINSWEELQVINKSFNIQSKFTEDKVWVARVVDCFLVWLYLFDLVWFFFFFFLQVVVWHTALPPLPVPHIDHLWHTEQSPDCRQHQLWSHASCKLFNIIFWEGFTNCTVPRPHPAILPPLLHFFFKSCLRTSDSICSLAALIQRIEHPARAEVEMERSIRF